MRVGGVLIAAGIVAGLGFAGLTRASGAAFDRDPRWIGGLAEEVARDAMAGPSARDFATGSARFDGEWAVVTCLSASVGLDRALDVMPERADVWVPALSACADVLASAEAVRFGTDPWGGLEPSRGRAFWGYVARGLGAARARDPAFPHADLHDRLVADLAARIDADGVLALETYPGERYPADQAVVLAALGQHPDRERWAPTLDRALQDWRGAIDPTTGLARQSLPHGPPRGSGTAFTALWLAEIDPGLAIELYRAMDRHLAVGFAGMGAMREHPHGVAGAGDIDSGPLVLGTSISATGFGLAGAVAAGDRAGFVRLHRTAVLFGAPVPTARGWRYASGGALGNALLLASVLPARADRPDGDGRGRGSPREADRAYRR